MGWLFGKKVPKVPLPKGMSMDDRVLRFPTTSTPQQRVVPSDQVKEAVGFDQPFALPEELPETFDDSTSEGKDTLPQPEERLQGPLFVKVEVYQNTLAYLDGLRWDINTLSETNKQLDGSEYNEEANFERLRRSVKSIHDKLLQVDKALFKSQGD